MNKKENRGITLVALVITIIVLIILAGVSINAVMNDGLIGNAKNARDEFNKAKQDEEGKLSDLEADMADFNIQTPYKLKNGYITGVVLNKGIAETVNQFESKLPEGYEVYSILGAELTNTEKEGPITTGMILKKDEEEIGKIVIYGDFKCDNYGEVDGKINATDSAIFTVIFKGSSMEEGDKVAADINQDNRIDWVDYSILREYSRIPIPFKTYEIYQNAYAPNPNTTIIEYPEETKQNWVSSLGDTIKTKFEWQEGDEENNHDGYYIIKVESGVTVGSLGLPSECVVTRVNESSETVKLGAEDTIQSGDKISLLKTHKGLEATLLIGEVE